MTRLTAAKGILCAALLLVAACANLVKASKNEKDLQMRNEELRRKLAENEDEVSRLQRFLQAEQEVEPLPSLEPPQVTKQVLKPKVAVVPKEDTEWLDESRVLANSQHESMTWYQMGLEKVGSGNFDEAVRAFDSFLKMNPDHVYADRAQYWIGECYLRNREYGLAVIASNLLVTRYPYSFRLPQAVYNAALSHLAMGHTAQAQHLLREVLRYSPPRKVSESASKKLAEIAQTHRG